jgi:hypothetical protein
MDRGGAKYGRRSSAWPFVAVPLSLLLSSRVHAAGALDLVAQEASLALGQTPSSSVVVAAPLATDVVAPKSAELALRIAALVAGKMHSSSHAHPQTLQLAPARAIAGRASALIFVQTEIFKGELRTTVDVYPSMANAWDRIRNPLPSPSGHAFASAKIDAEIRSFLAPLLLEQASVHRARHDESDVLAVACGDIDGDGGDEIALVSRERIVMGRVRDGRFVTERAVAWSELAPRAAVPMRQALAGAAIAPGALAVGSTERGSLSLSGDFLRHVPLSGIPAWGGDGVVCLLPEPSAGSFDGAPVDCAISRDPKLKMAVPAPRFDAFAAQTISDAQGNARAVVAVREPSGRLKIKWGDGPPIAPDGTFGSTLAVCDLDQDGAPEIASSAMGQEDALDVWNIASNGTGGAGGAGGAGGTGVAGVETRLHLPAPGGVSALGVCPPEQDGAPALVAVVGNELWVVRAPVQGGRPK